MKTKLLSLAAIVASAFLLSGCGKKTVSQVTPTPVPKVFDIPVDNRPQISLTPRADGHMLYLKMTGVPSNITSIEYELLYTATDQGNEIEKGLGDTIKEISPTISRDLLLGTESCTSGCKYKYDEGVNGGTLTLNFITKDGQTATYESPFTLTAGSSVNKQNGISLSTENFTVPLKAKVPAADYFILLKNYRGGFSVFSSGSSTLTGNYPQK